MKTKEQEHLYGKSRYGDKVIYTKKQYFCRCVQLFDLQWQKKDSARLTDEELKKFHTSLGDVLGCIKHSKSKEELKTYLVGNSMMALEIDAIQVLQTLTGMPVETEKGEEKMELCKALQEWSDEERSEGRQEILTELVKEGCISIAEAARRASMSEEEFRRKMDEMRKEK